MLFLNVLVMSFRLVNRFFFSWMPSEGLELESVNEVRLFEARTLKIQNYGDLHEPSYLE